MFSDLPKLFDRDFVIGYFVPVVLFLSGTLGLLAAFDLLQYIVNLLPPGLKLDIVLGTTLFGVTSWLGAVFLLAINHDVIRLLEGYGRLNPAQFLVGRQRQRYKKMDVKKEQLRQQRREYKARGESFPRTQQLLLNRTWETLVESFPDEEKILPTTFGNLVRAFESYPRLMYGLDAIPSWGRLLAVVPKDYREIINSAKAETDFWVNLVVLSAALGVEYVGLAWYRLDLRVWWVPAAALLISVIAHWRARSAVTGWGELVKSAYDVFLPELRKKLSFTAPADAASESEMWKRFSEATIYRLPNRLPARSEAEQQAEKQDAPRRNRMLLLYDGEKSTILLVSNKQPDLSVTEINSTTAAEKEQNT